jgi:hypothetical protein
MFGVPGAMAFMLAAMFMHQSALCSAVSPMFIMGSCWSSQRQGGQSGRGNQGSHVQFS